MKVKMYFCEVIAKEKEIVKATTPTGARLSRVIADTDCDTLLVTAKFYMNDHQVIFYNREVEL